MWGKKHRKTKTSLTLGAIARGYRYVHTFCGDGGFRICLEGQVALSHTRLTRRRLCRYRKHNILPVKQNHHLLHTNTGS